jgi:hypothetical protein
VGSVPDAGGSAGRTPGPRGDPGRGHATARRAAARRGALQLPAGLVEQMISVDRSSGRALGWVVPELGQSVGQHGTVVLNDRLCGVRVGQRLVQG